jgi:hypothetical protein
LVQSAFICDEQRLFTLCSSYNARHMLRILGLLGLIIALAIGFYIHTRQAQSVAPAAGSPRAAIDITGVKNDLLAFANAEKQQFALEGKYLSFDELRAKGTALPADHRGPYAYAAEISDSNFRITATCSEPAMCSGARSFSVDQTMQVQTGN